MARGRVKWFSADKRFGFIAQADGPDVFVHLSDVEDGRPLREGEVVEFEVTQAPKGPKAVRVRRVEAVAREGMEAVIEKPYVFVPKVRARQEPLAQEAGHEQFASQRYSGRLSYRLQALTHLFVASGRYALSEDVGFGQEQVVCSCYRVAGQPAVPGSSLKGAVRAVFEAVTPSCAVTNHRESCRAEGGQNPELCPACAVFGAMGYLGRVRFGDAIFKGQTELYHLQALYRPRRRDGRKFYRHGRMREDPENEPIEVIPQGSSLEGALDFEDLSAEELGALCFALGLDGSFCLKLGGGKPACLGSAVFDPQEMVLHADGRWLRSEEGEQVHHGDAALDFIREQMQAAWVGYLQREAVEALRGALRYPDERPCPTGMY
jgi:cold shock CspA family protein